MKFALQDDIKLIMAFQLLCWKSITPQTILNIWVFINFNQIQPNSSQFTAIFVDTKNDFIIKFAEITKLSIMNKYGEWW